MATIPVFVPTQEDRGSVVAKAEVTVPDAHDDSTRTLTVEVEHGGVAVNIPGYGTADMMPGHGPVVFLEFRSGVPVLCVWADITTDEPTHQIDLSGAAESKRGEP